MMKDKNLLFLKDLYPDLYRRAAAAGDDGTVEVIMSKDGNPVPVMTHGGKKFYLHSRYDPLKESERFIGGIDVAKHDLFIVFGMAFGYHVERLLESAGGDSMVLVIEKSPALFARLMESRDMTSMLGDRRLAVLIDPNEEALAASLKGKSTRSVSFLTHRGSHQVYPEYYGNMLEKARSFISSKDVNIATLAKFEKIWSSNIARNINHFMESPGAAIFYGKLTGFPAIVVSAGPSLTESLSFIRRSIDRCIIIAVDTAYRILDRNGIDPHFCVAVDPQVINARYFEGITPGKTILITEPTVHPSVYRLFRGRVAVTGVAFNIMKWIERIAGEKGEVTHGGSVSTNAYDFARRTGASPVYMTGQDLSFTRGMAHAAGSYLEEQIFIARDRLKNELMHNRFQLTALPKIIVKGIRSGCVHTNHKMMIFQSWFEKRNDPFLINATYDGAYLNGIRHMNMEDVVMGGSGADIWGILDGIYGDALPELKGPKKGARELKAIIGIMLEEVAQLIPVLERAGGFSGTLHDMMKSGNRDGSKVDYILKKLSEADGVIESKIHIKDMISLTIQKVIHTINEGYEIDEDDAALGESQLVAKKSMYLYR